MTFETKLKLGYILYDVQLIQSINGKTCYIDRYLMRTYVANSNRKCFFNANVRATIILIFALLFYAWIPEKEDEPATNVKCPEGML